jgi:outer membrane lipoprotein-sorting protein
MALQSGLGVFCGGLAAMLLLVLAPELHLHADDLFDDIYRRGAPMNARLHSLSASFTETTSSTLLATPVVATGHVVARRPSTVRLTYDTPDPRVVLIADGQMTVDWPARRLLETRDVRASLQRAERHFFDKSPAELRKLFDVTAAVASDRRGAWHLTFVPKRRQLRQGLDRLHLWIDQETLLLQALLMEMPGGDTRLMEFSDLVVNPAMAPDVFVRPSGR